MKRIVLTLALIAGISMGCVAQNSTTSLFNKENTEKFGPGLPGHGESGNQPAPLGSGTLMLVGLCGAYAFAKRNKKH